MNEDILFAIQHAALLSFVYDEKPRTVEVHAYGTSVKDGAPVIRAWQVAGESSRPLPCWALMRVENIQEFEIAAANTSHAPRDGFKPGDKQMREIFAEVAA